MQVFFFVGFLPHDAKLNDNIAAWRQKVTAGNGDPCWWIRLGEETAVDLTRISIINTQFL